MTKDKWEDAVFNLLNQYVYSSMSKSELKSKYELLCDNVPIETLCEGCNVIFTERIFRRKKDETTGLCFNCY